MEEAIRQFVTEHPIAVVLLMWALILAGVYVMRKK